MPELPEVETVRKGLERLVVGKTIQKVQVLWPKIIEQPETPIFEASLVGGDRPDPLDVEGSF